MENPIQALDAYVSLATTTARWAMSFGVRHHITSVGTNNVTYIDVESSVRPASTAHLLFIAHVISLI